jgi:hypothetical protein
MAPTLTVGGAICLRAARWTVARLARRVLIREPPDAVIQQPAGSGVLIGRQVVFSLDPCSAAAASSVARSVLGRRMRYAINRIEEDSCITM